MGKKIEKWALVILTVCGLALDFRVLQKTWNYPDYNIVPTNMSTIYFRAADLMFVLILCGIVIFICASIQKRGAMKKLYYLTVPVVIAVYCVYLMLVDRSVIYGMQRMVIGTYFLICLAAAKILASYFEKKAAACLYLALHVLLVIFCSWHFFYREIYMSPPTIVWMAACAAIAFVTVFLEGSTLFAEKRKTAIAIALVLLQTVVFSLGRIKYIFMSLGNTGSGFAKVNWIQYRGVVLDGLISGNFDGTILDPPTMESVPGFHIIWSGVAFGRAEPLAYIIILAAIIFLLMRMFIAEKGRPVMRALILSVIIANVWGCLCEVNLFYSAEIGILASRNVFQLVTVIVVAYLYGKDLSGNNPHGKALDAGRG